MLYLICYDVSHNGRRKKTADALLRYGDRVQRSAFECNMKSEAQLKELLRRVRPHITGETDTVRVYRLCASCRSETQCIGVDHSPGPVPSVIVL